MVVIGRGICVNVPPGEIVGMGAHHNIELKRYLQPWAVAVADEFLPVFRFQPAPVALAAPFN